MQSKVCKYKWIYHFFYECILRLQVPDDVGEELPVPDVLPGEGGHAAGHRGGGGRVRARPRPRPHVLLRARHRVLDRGYSLKLLSF